MASVIISRDKGWVDRARKYKVFANKQCLGKVASGETQNFSLEPGSYDIYLKVDWCRSNKLPLKIETGQTVVLQGGSSLRGWRLLLAFVYITLLPHQYLWLKRGP